MVDRVRQRVSALYRYGLSRLRNFVVGRYGIHLASLRGLTPVRVCIQVTDGFEQKVSTLSRKVNALLNKSRVIYLSRDRTNNSYFSFTVPCSSMSGQCHIYCASLVTVRGGYDDTLESTSFLKSCLLESKSFNFC